MTRHYGRATKGKRAYGKCPYNRGKNVTLIGAIADSVLLLIVLQVMGLAQPMSSP